VMKPKKRKLTREELDDQKFQNAMEGVEFRARIEREASKHVTCRHCGGFEWKMQPKFIFNWLENSVFATLVCRQCKHGALYATQFIPDRTEEEEEELDEFTDQVYSQLGIRVLHPVVEDKLKARLRRRLARLDPDQWIRLLRYLG